MERNYRTALVCGGPNYPLTVKAQQLLQSIGKPKSRFKWQDRTS